MLCHRRGLGMTLEAKQLYDRYQKVPLVMLIGYFTLFQFLVGKGWALKLYLTLKKHQEYTFIKKIIYYDNSRN